MCTIERRLEVLCGRAPTHAELLHFLQIPRSGNELEETLRAARKGDTVSGDAGSASSRFMEWIICIEEAAQLKCFSM